MLATNRDNRRHTGIIGDIQGIIGDKQGIIGDIQRIMGDVPRIIGDIQGIIGDIQGIIGGGPPTLPFGDNAGTCAVVILQPGGTDRLVWLLGEVFGL